MRQKRIEYYKKHSKQANLAILSEEFFHYLQVELLYRGIKIDYFNNEVTTKIFDMTILLSFKDDTDIKLGYLDETI